jgi:hypothetical protein
MRGDRHEMSALAASDPSPTNTVKKLSRPHKDAAADIPKPPASIGVRRSAAVHSSRSF